ncbi:hypothetical protein FN846DRAFT_893793 [Sphaerosporella brunnea]|uniref:Uncharacterized protein n=1 Tax=Sphaerosporella brunnea TaxID=1250544 RepID=A0A5J5EMB3_9PEZI|nr:hypothetical protein FN846DRAFT_893793 [Sphaerosporella brunnea]
MSRGAGENNPNASSFTAVTRFVPLSSPQACNPHPENQPALRLLATRLRRRLRLFVERRRVKRAEWVELAVRRTVPPLLALVQLLGTQLHLAAGSAVLTPRIVCQQQTQGVRGPIGCGDCQGITTVRKQLWPAGEAAYAQGSELDCNVHTTLH